jgi:hypothetical protein|tara:strand:- start:94 stop:444 length:351 start_codon:yes stop_codon:yes gene_type:complete
MVRSIEVKKASVRDRLIVDVDVFMNHPNDYDFSPRASMEGNSLSVTNAGDEAGGSIDLDDDQMFAAERDRMVELRVKFSVEGMHGTLTHKTTIVRSGPNAKKLAEPRWKTVLPLSM